MTPVAADNIRRGSPGRDQELRNWIAFVEAMGKVGIPVLCYNLGQGGRRTSNKVVLRGGAITTEHDYEASRKLPPAKEIYTENQLWEALTLLIERIIPVCEKANVKMGYHPNDPAVSPYLGSAQIMINPAAYRRLFSIADSPYNGVSFCQGNFRSMKYALVVIIVAGSWIDGSAPIGQIAMRTVYLIAPLYSVWLLAAMHYLDNTAHHAFNAFRSALGVSPDESRGLQYELTTLPAPQAIWVAAIGAAFGLLVLILGNIELRFRNAPIVLSAVAPLSMLGFIVAANLLYHTVHQLRLVSRIHRVAAAIDPFDFTPLYAFSRLSAQTGLIFLLLMYIDFVVNPETFANAALLALNALGLPFIAAACFILPLAGMHRRLDAVIAASAKKRNLRLII